MKILNFKAENVHGYLNFDIDFDEEVTFLIGINGTGKTSILNLILGLISPSFKYLNQIQFSFCQITVGENIQEPTNVISAVNREDKHLEITVFDNLGNQVVTGTLNKCESKLIDSEGNVDAYRERHKQCQMEFESQQLYKVINEKATPLFLGLGRRIYEGSHIDQSIRTKQHLFRYRRLQTISNDPLNASLVDLQAIIYDYYRLIGAKQTRLNELFKNQILEVLFEFNENTDFSFRIDSSEIEEKRKQLLTAVGMISAGNLSSKISSFFDKLVELQQEIDVARKKKESKTDELYNRNIGKWFVNRPQLTRIDDIVKLSLEYQEEINKLNEPLNRLKSIIDAFFQEGAKELIITPEGELIINLKKTEGKASCFELSSGEKQILTMIGHLVFFERSFGSKSGIFIIDEPEISLHLAWQEIFVESIQTASQNSQLILATHSPAIIAHYSEANCEDLTKLN